MKIKKVFLICVVLVVIEVLVYGFLNFTQFNKGSYRFADFNVSVDSKGKDLKTEISSGDTKITLGLPIANAKIKTTGDLTTLDNSNTTVNYEVKKSGYVRGLKETIILKNINASNEYSYSFNLENVSSFKEDSKTKIWHFFNNQNKEIFYIPRGVMEDSNGFTSDLVDVGITKKGSNYVLKLIADKDWIEDPERSFPVKIDPSILIAGPRLNLSVIRIGRFRWKMSIEYEIKDEQGKVLGSDVVITDVGPGETNEDISLFLKDYLTKRLAVWSIAQGNYSLREMSNDRLDSPNFQKEDSGDDVDDGHKEERQARKKLIESFNKSSYPDISLDLAEAEQIQNPIYDEIDKNGALTGKKIKSKPTFIIENEKIGAGIEILRPNGVGDATGILSMQPGTGAHWDKVDEYSADDNTTYVQQGPGGGMQTDYYALTDTALTANEIINTIDVVSRSYQGIDYGGYSKAGVRLSAADSYGAQRNNGFFTTNTESSLARPGGGAWAVADLNSLQAAAELLSGTSPGYSCCINQNSCFDCIESGTCYDNSIVYLTQIYITVNYASTISTNKQIKGGVQIRGGVRL